MQLFEMEGMPWDKVASAELEEDATQWPRQVLTELFRVLPEISEYTPDVKFLRVDEEQGYALGVVVVSNETNTTLGAEAVSGSSSAPKALVLVVVKNGRLCPIDTVMSTSGKMYPLTADRLREVLYRPESFELLSDDWSDSSLAQLFAPPGRGNELGASSVTGAQTYLGSGVKMAMLEAIADSVLEPDMRAFTVKASAGSFSSAIARNLALQAALERIDAMETLTEKSAARYEQVLEEMHPAQAVLTRFDDERGVYVVKLANRDFGVLREMQFDRGAFMKFAGTALAKQVDTAGAVALAQPSDRVVVVPHGNTTLSLIERAGHYTAYDATTGKPVNGTAIPGLIDGTGARVPLVLFVNAMGATVQDQIAGQHASSSDAQPLPHDPPKGEGCFVTGQRDYDYIATVPVTVHGSTSDAMARRYNCVDLTGDELTIVLQRDAEDVLAFPARHELVLPWTTTFVSTATPLPHLLRTGVDRSLERDGKLAASALAGRISVTPSPVAAEALRITYGNLPKLAAAFPAGDYSPIDATYLLCVAGLDVPDATDVLSKVAEHGYCSLSAQDLGGYAAIDAKKRAALIKEARTLRCDLLKEAAAIADPMTVDAVLSLDFINAENVRTFISMIPYLEKALNRICELTFASRLGINEIPETAASRAARGLDDTIRGLKGLALRQIQELP